jgi:hypothetical protein
MLPRLWNGKCASESNNNNNNNNGMVIIIKERGNVLSNQEVLKVEGASD